MLNTLRHRFGTIRWKLAGSYVLVALMIALLGALSVMAALLILFNSRVLPNARRAQPIGARFARQHQPGAL